MNVVGIVIIFLIYDDLGQVTELVDASDSITILHSPINIQTPFSDANSHLVPHLALRLFV